jgi:peptide subunit release factor 1 (eRF1)
MTISLYIPKGTKNCPRFVDSEIATARNIKSKQTRENVLSGLLKIRHCI